MRILAIGAHPDDIELGCGGLLLKAVKLDHEIFFFILTRGEAGQKVDGGEVGSEAKQSADTLGATLWFCEFEDTKLVYNGDLVNSIERIVNKVCPNLVLTHSMLDEHHDHRAVGRATTEAARLSENIFTYENPLTKDFVPQAYVDISDVINGKIQLLNLYPSQRDKDYLKSNAIFGLAQYRALQSRMLNVKFAEAFQITKLRLFDHSLVFQE